MGTIQIKKVERTVTTGKTGETRQKAKKTYGKIIYRGTLNLADLAEHIMKHGTVYTEDVVIGGMLGVGGVGANGEGDEEVIVIDQDIVVGQTNDGLVVVGDGERIGEVFGGEVEAMVVQVIKSGLVCHGCFVGV